MKVIPVKYGRELTHYKLESNISTKQLHVPTKRERGGEKEEKNKWMDWDVDGNTKKQE